MHEIVKGSYNTIYHITGLEAISQIQVVKPDGKIFYLPIVDIIDLSQTINLLHEARILQQKLETKGLKW